MSKLNIESRLIEDSCVKTYATIPNAVTAAEKVAERLQGMVNCYTVPSIVRGQVRYALIFHCFREEQDMFVVARQGHTTFR